MSVIFTSHSIRYFSTPRATCLIMPLAILISVASGIKKSRRRRRYIIDAHFFYFLEEILKLSLRSLARSMHGVANWKSAITYKHSCKITFGESSCELVDDWRLFCFERKWWLLDSCSVSSLICHQVVHNLEKERQRERNTERLDSSLNFLLPSSAIPFKVLLGCVVTTQPWRRR